MLDRVGKAIMMAAESETSEIIRRRLFEWDPKAVSQDGRVLLTQDAVETCKAMQGGFATTASRSPVVSYRPCRETFEATYPFHPAVLSVFERKWQEMPRFQQTRAFSASGPLGIHSFQQGFKGAQRDPLIGWVLLLLIILSSGLRSLNNL